MGSSQGISPRLLVREAGGLVSTPLEAFSPLGSGPLSLARLSSNPVRSAELLQGDKRRLFSPTERVTAG